MDTESRPYTKLLEEFGKPVNFESKKPAFIAHLPNHFSDIDRGFALEEIHVRRDPNFKTFSNIPQMSKNTVNTERVSTNDRSMYHYEGGWPHDFNDFGEEKKRKIFIKKNIERTKDSPHDKFLPSLMKMCNHITDIIRENNQIDMFEEYFDQGEPEHNIEKLNVKTLMLFKDPSEVCKRSVSRISWHPDGPQSLAAAYSIMRFQKQPSNMDYQVRKKIQNFQIFLKNSNCFNFFDFLNIFLVLYLGSDQPEHPSRDHQPEQPDSHPGLQPPKRLHDWIRVL